MLSLVQDPPMVKAEIFSSLARVSDLSRKSSADWITLYLSQFLSTGHILGVPFLRCLKTMNILVMLRCLSLPMVEQNGILLKVASNTTISPLSMIFTLDLGRLVVLALSTSTANTSDQISTLLNYPARLAIQLDLQFSWVTRNLNVSLKILVWLKN